jgi:hypothetical protein
MEAKAVVTEMLMREEVTCEDPLLEDVVLG